MYNQILSVFYCKWTQTLILSCILLPTVVSRLSEKPFVLFIQYPLDEGLFLLDCRQFKQPKNRSLFSNQSEVPWISLGDRIVKLCATLMWGRLQKPLKKLQRPWDIMYFCLRNFSRNVCQNWTFATGYLLSGNQFKIHFKSNHVACVRAQIASQTAKLDSNKLWSFFGPTISSIADLHVVIIWLQLPEFLSFSLYYLNFEFPLGFK